METPQMKIITLRVLNFFAAFMLIGLGSLLAGWAFGLKMVDDMPFTLLRFFGAILGIAFFMGVHSWTESPGRGSGVNRYEIYPWD